MLERNSYPDRHLVALGDAYALRAMSAVDDHVRLHALTDQYLRDAMVLLSGTHGAVCARQVRDSARRAGGERISHRLRPQSLRRLAGDSLRTYTLEWHHQLMEMGGPR